MFLKILFFSFLFCSFSYAGEQVVGNFSASGNVGIGTVSNSPLNASLIVVTGNVGIGTINPGQTLDTNGSIRIRGTNNLWLGDDNKVGIVSSAATNGELRLGVNNSEIMRINTTGVGIGISAPAAALDVAGGIRSTLGTAGQAACWKSDKVLGQCTSAVGAGGASTCS